MVFDTKVALLVLDDLAVWQKLNVTAFFSPRELPEPRWKRWTGYDAANRAAFRAEGADAPDLVGVALRGPKRDVDRATKGSSLHP